MDDFHKVVKLDGEMVDFKYERYVSTNICTDRCIMELYGDTLSSRKYIHVSRSEYESFISAYDYYYGYK